jgi:hypothetical protein
MARWNRTAALFTTSLLVLGVSSAASARDFILEGAQPVVAAAAVTDSRCGLLRAGAERSSATDCTSCHAAAEHATHPVEMNYEASRRSSHSIAGELRPLAELRRAGIRLVGGKVTCVTCHDAGSRVADHLALPADAMVRPAVNLRNRASYAFPVASQRQEQLADGARVSPTALCTACHALD